MGQLPRILSSRGVARFIDFLKEAFGAVERGRVYNEDGTIGHAEVWIGDSVVMMFDAKKDWPDTPGFLTLYVEDCDAVHQRALDAGATTITELSTNAWGNRGSRICGPFGNIWWIQTRIEDVGEEDIEKRMQKKEYIEDLENSVETFDRAIRSMYKS